MDSMEMRRDAIVQLINEMGTVSFAQIKKEFPNVSEMTLRTDLKILDEEKKILRVHGGAKSVQVIIGTDDFLNRKSVRNIAEKQEIAWRCFIRTLHFFWIREARLPHLHGTSRTVLI